MSDYEGNPANEQMELDSSSDEGHLSDEPSAPKSKRARASAGKSKTQRKKYVRGKLGGLQGIMRMPIEIFTEIACHITPGDLISLIRTNKFFRQMLLRRSALPVWQSAQNTVPNLPPCPDGMSEPQYAALLFSKACTLCGSATTTQPDPYLRARLCIKCRDTTLEEVPPLLFTIYHCRYVVASPVIKPISQSRHRRPASETILWCFRSDLSDIERRHEELTASNRWDELEEWGRELKAAVEKRNEEARPLRNFITSALHSRAAQLEEVKQKRRDAIHEKLIELGWERKELVFDREHAKPWRALVEAPKPLTERIWANILPKLTPLLEENRLRIQEAERIQRVHDRRNKLNQLLSGVKRETHPYQSILDALAAETSDGREPPSTDTLLANLPNPFPETVVVLEWDFIKDLYDEDISLERVEELFGERRPQLDQKVLEWRADFEARLLERFDSTLDGNDSNVILKVRGSTDATQHLSPTSRTLLRADTLFTRVEKEGSPFFGLRDCIWMFTYPALAFPEKDGLDSYWHIDTANRLDGPEGYVGKSEMSRTAKGLLKGMGMPDAAHVELVSMGKVFTCGRCGNGTPGTWESLLWHYDFELFKWGSEESLRPEQDLRYPIVFRNIHDLNSATNNRPLVRILPGEEPEPAATSEEGSPAPTGQTTVCILCTLSHDYSNTTELVVAHLEDVHDISDSVRGLHYRCRGDPTPMHSVRDPLWKEKWEAWNKTRATQAGSSGVIGTTSSTATES